MLFLIQLESALHDMGGANVYDKCLKVHKVLTQLITKILAVLL